VRRASALLLVTLLALAGCGFVKSGERGSSKPDGFTLRGYVSVGASASVASASRALPGGSPCEAPAAASDVRAGGAVRVADPAGHTLSAGELAAGIRDDASGRCNFGFQITGVPGGVDNYVIGVGNRQAASFPAQDLRSGKPAVITVDV
jgi:hypothetical protein